MSQHSNYDLKSVKMPYMTGAALKLFAALVESPLRQLLATSLFESMGLTALRERQFDEPPTLLPIHHVGVPSSEARSVPEHEWPTAPVAPGPGFRFATVHEYAQAYRTGEITPEEVAQRIWDAISDSDATDPPLRAFVTVERDDLMAQARQATERIQAGRALSLFDGVPVAVKDEVDMRPYPTSVGTAFLGAAPCREDSTVVARMRAVGALLIGKTNMHEIGIGVTGLNPIHGTPRNPYAPDHYTGGSSSGSAAAVAAGLCPVAIGADGGGSIRIPAAFCGVVGLKPTFGRVSEHGAAPLCWSVAHLGPLAATATDAALAYAVLAGPDPHDPTSWHQPSPTLGNWGHLEMGNVTVGVYWPWFRHASAEVVSVCEGLLAEFEHRGARLREIAIPDLESARVAHTITIVSEMAQALNHTYAQHHLQHGLDVRTNLALARMFSARDYIQAQRVRTRLMAHFRQALAEVDVIVTPTTGLAAPPISPASLAHGESDLTTLVEIMRFATPANLTGLPAISFPAGYTGDGLPVGMHVVGRAWEEATLLRLALAAEQIVERRAPQRCYRVLR